ncbi:MAG: hypothetical protein HS114_34490 [Anaerolineales bacterium]|nr:hypothetical protein [Anaerolineales bacterium]
MKTNLPEITKAYLGSATFFTIAGEGAMLAAVHYGILPEPDYLLPILAGFGIPAIPFGFYLGARVVYLARPPARARPAYPSGGSSLFENLAVWIMPQPKAPPGGWIFGGKPARVIKYKPEAKIEFVFWEEGMVSMITEGRLLEFCRVTWRRQQQVRYGDLSANQIFSRLYFTRDARPRWPLPDYTSVMHILLSRRLIINRWQGKGGEMRYPPYSTVEEAKKRWGNLQEISS